MNQQRQRAKQEKKAHVYNIADKKTGEIVATLSYTVFSDLLQLGHLSSPNREFLERMRDTWQTRGHIIKNDKCDVFSLLMTRRAMQKIRKEMNLK
jgi:hypothetical protein